MEGLTEIIEVLLDDRLAFLQEFIIKPIWPWWIIFWEGLDNTIKFILGKWGFQKIKMIASLNEEAWVNSKLRKFRGAQPEFEIIPKDLLFTYVITDYYPFTRNKLSNWVSPVPYSSTGMKEACTCITKLYPFDCTSLLLENSMLLKEFQQMIFKQLFKIPFLHT